MTEKQEANFIDAIKAKFVCDYKTGELRRLDGKKITFGFNKGYLTANLHGNTYPVARIIYILYHEKVPIIVDHRNGVKLDNRIENLRNCTDMENHWNSGVQKNSSSGVTGVTKNHSGSGYIAYIFCQGKNKHLGTFSTIQKATHARWKAEQELLGEFVPTALGTCDGNYFIPKRFETNQPKRSPKLQGKLLA